MVGTVVAPRSWAAGVLDLRPIHRGGWMLSRPGRLSGCCVATRVLLPRERRGRRGAAWLRRRGARAPALSASAVESPGSRGASGAIRLLVFFIPPIQTFSCRASHSSCSRPPASVIVSRHRRNHSLPPPISCHEATKVVGASRRGVPRASHSFLTIAQKTIAEFLTAGSRIVKN